MIMNAVKTSVLFVFLLNAMRNDIIPAKHVVLRIARNRK
jgi:hypothetical protein